MEPRSRFVTKVWSRSPITGPARCPLSQTPISRCYSGVSARGKTIEAVPAADAFSFEGAFYAHYDRIARAIVRIVRDPARAEELAVDVFWKFWRTPRAHGEKAGGWLYRAAIRVGLNELRRQTRAARHEQLSETTAASATPEQVHAALEEQEQVRAVLAVLHRRQAELLLLRANGLSYEEVASALNLNPASVGTLLSRAQQAFRKEYISRYGEQ